MKKIIYIALTGLLFVSACKKDLDVGGTAMKDVAGDWYLQYSVDGGKTFEPGYTHFSTYNTADNSSTTMWIDDLETFWQMKGKININLSNLTFSGTDVQNQYYDSKFTLDGKILKMAAKAPASKTVTDSLYMKIRFDDDDEEIEYVLAGYRKTGFLEDEH